MVSAACEHEVRRSRAEEEAYVDDLLKEEETKLTLNNPLCGLSETERRELYFSLGHTSAECTARMQQPPVLLPKSTPPVPPPPPTRLMPASALPLASVEAELAEEYAQAKQGVHDAQYQSKEKAYKAQLYNIATSGCCGPARGSGGEGQRSSRATQPVVGSALHGPYVTLDGDGQHTRFEALCARHPVHRSAASTLARKPNTSTQAR